VRSGVPEVSVCVFGIDYAVDAPVSMALRWVLCGVLSDKHPKCGEGRIAPTLSALENNSRQLNAQLAAKASQTSDR
jgi:hypothetical protein